MRSALKIRSGFTLVEVALAATILLVGFAGMAEALIIGSEMLDTARKQTIAAQIVQAEIERLRMLDWKTATAKDNTIQAADPNQATELALGPGLASVTKYFTPSPSSALAQIAPSSLFVNCTRTVELANGRTDLRKVTITVTWKSITGKIHSRSCNAYIGKYGLNVSYQKL
jgi:Tfp pilus assembly protein PilV